MKRLGQVDSNWAWLPSYRRQHACDRVRTMEPVERTAWETHSNLLTLSKAKPAEQADQHEQSYLNACHDAWLTWHGERSSATE